MLGNEEYLPERRRFNPMEAGVGVFTHPVTAMRQIAAARPWPIAIGLTIAIALIGGLVNLAVTPAGLGPEAAPPANMPPELAGLAAASRSPLVAVTSAVICSPVLLAFTAAILYGVGRLLGGRGHFSALFSTLAFASLPSVLLAPVMALLNLGGALLVLSLGMLLSVATTIWVIVLDVLGIRESLELSTGRAVATLLIPMAVLIAFACAMIALVIGLAAAAFGGT